MDFHHSDNSDWKECKLCDKNGIHANDFDNHLNSRKHKLNIKKSSSEPEHKSENFRCDICNKSLTSEEFYRRHLESKAHKKQYKKLLLKESSGDSEDTGILRGKFRKYSLFPTSAVSEAGSTSSILDSEDVFNRKKYKVRSDPLAFKFLDTYIYSMVSYLSLKLALDVNYTDFYISVNEKNWYTFGDIVINLIHKGKSTIHAIRCKHVSDTAYCIESLKDGNIYLEKEYESIRYIKKQNKSSAVKFLIFTTHSTNSKFATTIDIALKEVDKTKKDNNETIRNVTFKVHPMGKKNDVLNVSNENDNVSLIYPEDENCDLPPLFLYTCQRIHPHMKDEVLKKKFSVDRTFHNNYRDYIEHWAEGKLGGNYYLTKKDVLLKLGELLLQPYIFVPKMMNFKSENFEAWNRVIKETDVIMIRNEPFVLSKLCEPFNQMIEEALSVDSKDKVKIDSITKTVNITNELINKIKDASIKAYLFEVEEFNHRNPEIHLTKLYNVFWKAGKIPLLLSIDDEQDSKSFILDVISFLKAHGVYKKFMLKSEMPFLLRNIPKNLKVFSCLDDVKDLVNLEDIRIRITRDFSLNLKEISQSDPFFLRWISPSIFFDMILDKFSMRKDETSKMNIQTDLKIILNDETKEKVREILYKGEAVPKSLGRLAGIDPTLF